jgi:hypothetical protein
VLGRPNSLLKAAAPKGAAIMMSSAEAMRAGLPKSRSQGCGMLGIFKLETENPVKPAFGFAPMPVAPSSRISPPEPVAAPGNGEMAVG